jgi:hypothetical protein
MKKIILEEKERRGPGLKAANDNLFRDKVYKAEITHDKKQALHAGIKLFESKTIIDPRDGCLKLANNPMLLMNDMIKRTFDGSMQFVNDLERELAPAIDHCDEYIWIEKENGEIKGI